jgi:hypothetical protein
MAGKIVRTGIVAVLAAIPLATGLPATAAHASPRVGQGEEIVVTYYSSAQETTIVGERAYGSCGLYETGTTSVYYSVNEYLCPG